jgi:hypothetical protein
MVDGNKRLEHDCNVVSAEAVPDKPSRAHMSRDGVKMATSKQLQGERCRGGLVSGDDKLSM